MDLVPKPDQVAAAAGNVAQLLLGGGVADLRPMPRTLVARGAGHEVYRYRPEPDRERPGDPVLLVAPLAAPASCYDLRRGCSLVERLLGRGRPTYLVEFGETSFADPDLGLEPWVRHAVPTAVRAVSDHAGGAAVHLLGWSLGGIFALLAAADATDLPIVSLSVLGAPVDTTRVPMMAPPRPLLTASDWPDLVARTYRAVGAPAPLRWAFERAPVQRLVVRPMAVAAHLDDADWLAQLEAVERFTAATTAYAGRSYGQLYHRFGQGNALASGAIEVGGRSVSLAAVRAPVLVVAGATDGIAPVDAVRAVVPMLTGAREVRFEVGPGGHLDLLTGRAARESTWPVLEEWFEQWDRKRRPTR